VSGGHAVLYEPDLACPAGDGTVLATDIYRPAAGGRHPAVLQRTPYDKRQHPLTWPLLDPRKLAAAGYVVAIQDVRGRFASGGDFLPYLHEAADGIAAIDWMSRQDFCDGAVGMYGMSYMGGVQWLAAAAQPPALRALAPATAPFDFHADHFHRGGAVALGLLLTFLLAVIEPGRALRRGPAETLPHRFTALVDDIDRLNELAAALPLDPFEPLQRHDPELAAWLGAIVRGDEAAVPPRPQSAAVAVPALQIAGWHDTLLQPDLDRFAEMRARAATEEARAHTRLVVGPWAHAAFASGVGELDFGVRAAGAALDLRGDLTDLHRRWFDARLKGTDTSIDDEPPVRAFVMGENRWRDLDDWPPAGTTTRRLHLHAGGGLGEHAPEPSEPSPFPLDPDHPVPTHGGPILMPAGYLRGPLEQSFREAHRDVLLFTSAPLEAPLLVLGRVALEAWVATATPESDLVARLCDVHPDGRSFNLVDGILRLRAPDSPVRVSVDLWSTAHQFGAGHRLRLQVCASDFPRYDRCPGTGHPSAAATRVLPQRNALFHTPERPSALLLPVADP
jgi:putative CocE/NonD family hydrolase